ncbi:EamA family transporter [Saccharopolyspora sp. HNM0983]|uniref:EamA family transporter n=1 Tax=Saccharopolyspora montiporae TaxID=2781240 RepID=A0A929BBP4_9PSEU|nr:EamA family transporter [Saccharopolyspora sp. HNM0983]MBE9375071.1 EamA family transporter [Saccharopolyspora sp. HNM0983]
MNNPANYLRLGALALLWGSSFLLIKIGLQAMDPAQVAFTRIVLGALALLALCAVRGLRLGTGWALWRDISVAALFASALPWLLFGFAEQDVDSGLAGALNASTPLWTVLFGVLFARETAHPSRMSGLLIGFGGVLLIFAPWQSSGLLEPGVLACLAAAASYGIGYVYIGRRLTGRYALAPQAMAGMQLVAASGIAALALPVGGPHPVALDPVPLLAVGVLGVFGTGAAFALNYRIIAEEGPTTASTVTYLMPIVSVLLGGLVLGEEFGARVVLGVLVVLLGVGLTRRSAPRAASERTPAAPAEEPGPVMRAMGRYAQLADPMK